MFTHALELMFGMFGLVVGFFGRGCQRRDDGFVRFGIAAEGVRGQFTGACGPLWLVHGRVVVSTPRFIALFFVSKWKPEF